MSKNGEFKFGEMVENIAASDHNPIKLGIFVRKTRNLIAIILESDGYTTQKSSERIADGLLKAYAILTKDAR